MKLVSWNVNGLRACIQKGFLDQFNTFDADFYCLQETKLSEGQLSLDLPGYEQYWCYAAKKGYSGTAIFAKHRPLSVHYGLDVPELDTEGRLITLEYPEFYLVTCYTPNAQRGLARLEHRMKWDEAFRVYLQKLDAEKPVILCGDLNVAHKEIDLKNPKSNRGNAGFSDEERDSFQRTLDLGFTDTFRHLHPDAADCYSWWSYMFKARENNAGWRIDYFLVSDRIRQNVYRAEIHSDILGSDHCPVSIDLDIPCNGGIWTPGSLGEARLNLPEHTDTEKTKASAVSAKAIVPLSILCVLVLCCILCLPQITSLFTPEVIPTESPDLYTYTIFETRPKADYRYSIGGGTTAKLLAIIEYDNTYFLSDPILWSDYQETNTWLRVDLTDFGINHADDSWNLFLVDFDNLISSHLSDSATTPDCYIIPYYPDETHTQMMGWFIFMNLESPRTCTLSLDCNGEYITQSIRLLPDQDLSRLNDPIKTLPIEALLMEVKDDLRTQQQENWTDRVSMSISGTTYYARATQGDQTVQAGNYWVYVTPSQELLEYIPIEEIFFQARNLFLGMLPPGTYGIAYDSPIIRPLFSDSDLTQQTGWLVYGKDYDTPLLELSMECSFRTQDLHFTHQFLPKIVFGDVDYSAMTTPQLVAHIMSTEDLCDYIAANPDPVINFYSRIPVLSDLAFRDDAVSCLMNCTPPQKTEHSSVPYNLLGIPEIRANMSSKEEADYLTQQFPSSGNDFAAYFAIDVSGNLTNYETKDLVKILLKQTSNHGNAMNLCSSKSAKERVYTYFRDLLPILVEIEMRGNWFYFSNLYKGDPQYYNSILPYLNDMSMYMAYLQVDTAEEMVELSTSRIVSLLLCSEFVCEQLMASPAENLLVTELLTRHDAVLHLMSASNSTAYAKQAVHRLLSMEEFQTMMTPRQHALYLSRTYNSCPVPNTYLVEFDGDPIGLTTDALLQMLQEDDILYQYLSLPDGEEVRQQIYLIFMQRNALLKELQTRSDVPERMKELINPTEHPFSPLPYLLELWPYIDSLQPEQMTTAQLVDYIMGNTSICYELMNCPPGGNFDGHIKACLSTDPWLKELCTRSDAVESLMNCNPPESAFYSQIPHALLSQDLFFHQMTSQQEASFLLGVYPGYPTNGLWIYALPATVDPSTQSTAELVDLLLNSTWSSNDAMQLCSSNEVRWYAYVAMRDVMPSLLELETRNDALEAIEAVSDSQYYTGSILPYVVTFWSSIQALYGQ